MSIGDMAPFFAIIAIAIALFALWYIIRSGLSTGMKVLWVVLVLIFPVLGSIAYFLVYGTGGPASDKTAHEGRGLEEQRFGK